MPSLADWLQQQKQLSAPELQQAEQEFSGLTIPEREELWENLHEFFVKAPLSADRRFWLSYFRWYTQLTWNMLPSMTEEVVSSIAFPRQLGMAVLLEFDVLDELLRYLNAHPYTLETMPIFYAKVRDSVLKSGALVGVAKGREVSVAELVRELTVINQTKDALRQAEFTSRLKDVLFPKTEELLSQYIIAVPDDAATEYLNVLNFFRGVEPANIWSVVQTALHPERFANLEQNNPGDQTISESTGGTEKSLNRPGQRPPSPLRRPENLSVGAPSFPSPLPSGSAPVVQRPSSPPALPVAPPAPLVSSVPAESEGGKTNPAVPVAKISRPSNRDIRSMVENLFPPSAGSADEYLPKILQLLETLAARYEDDTIRELYFFNAETGRFEWVA